MVTFTAFATVSLSKSLPYQGHAGIRRHLAEELIYRFLIIRELRTFVYNGLSVLPTANSKLCIPSLVQSLRVISPLTEVAPASPSGVHRSEIHRVLFLALSQARPSFSPESVMLHSGLSVSVAKMPLEVRLLRQIVRTHWHDPHGRSDLHRSLPH